MPQIPNNIAQFIEKNHVVSLACYANHELWSASCFYVFDRENNRLIVLTKASTKHGQLMQQNPKIAGTISGQPEHIRDIEGIQFSATAQRIENIEENEKAQKLYYRRHPMAKLLKSDVWEIRFTLIKHTENRLAFAHKTLWQAVGSG